MAFTTGNDINILQATDTAVVGAYEGNDTYVLSGDLVGTGQQITISDTLGSNVLRLVNGVSIRSSIVTSSIVQLTLSNNAVVKILGANAFRFEFGGDILTGSNASKQTFTEFVTQTLGVASVPATGTATGGAVTIGQGSAGTITIPVATATSDAPIAPVVGTSAADTFVFDVEAAKSVGFHTIVTLGNGATGGNFEAGKDTLKVNLPIASGATTLNALNGQQGVVVLDDPFSHNTVVTFGHDVNGAPVVLTLAGVTDATLVPVVVF